MLASAMGQKHPRRASISGAPTILLAEDDPAVRELVANLLQKNGFAVLKAKHSAQALYFNGEFDGHLSLLLTDLCMAPHISGRQLACMIRLTRPGIPVLYLSGCVEDEGVVEEIEKGMAHFLPKPFSPETLLESVHLAIRQPIPLPT